MNKFWKWTERKFKNALGEEQIERVLTLRGTIAEESWFGDEATPDVFREELNSGKGDITVWINSPGGDCFAAAQIYNMLQNYKGKVTVKIDGLAASAASVIAMSGDEVLMSPVSMMMIHNPATNVYGDHFEMKKTIDMLEEVKASIINAYRLKSGISRKKLSELMDSETWMDATKAKELGFIDGIIGNKAGDGEDEEEEKQVGNQAPEAVFFSRKVQNLTIINKLEEHCKKQEKADEERPIEKYEMRLNNIKHFI